jgi:hypothetical protein
MICDGCSKAIRLIKGNLEGSGEIFWHGHHQFLNVFAALYLPQEGDGKLICIDVGGYPPLA